MTVQQERIDELVGQFATDFAATLHAATVLIGDKLGLYRALAETGPVDAAGLAEHAGYDARLVQGWLEAQYVSGYCRHDPAAGTWWLDDAQVAVLADPTSPAFMPGATSIAASCFKDEVEVRDRFEGGAAVGWEDHADDLYSGTERLFRPGYQANLASAWIPALDGVEAKLRAGARVADVGCGHGASTVLLAEAYPASTFVGFDFHSASIEVARKRAAEAGVADRVRFEVASAQDFPGEEYDLICVFDALHDMGDPAGAARHIRAALAPDGTWLLVEPMAGESIEENLNPVGRIFYSVAPFVCLPSALAQPGGEALGNQVADSTWGRLLTEAGFSRFRRATETPFNRIFEIRP